MVTREHLEEAKRELLKLCEKRESIIVEGDRPLLLIANYINDITSNKINYVSKITRDKDTFATLVYLLSKLTNCHAIINCVDVDQSIDNFDKFMAVEKSVSIGSLLNNLRLREYILDNKIDALLNHKILYETPHNRDIEIFEYNSSFNYGGLTGYAQQLEQAAMNNGITTQLGFTTYPLIEELHKYGYKFVDSVIERYSRFFSLGIIINKPLERNQMWPRSLEIIGTTEYRDNPDKLVLLSNTEIKFINNVLQDLNENGIYKGLVYKKVK
jgi:hypothetical protein